MFGIFDALWDLLDLGTQLANSIATGLSCALSVVTKAVGFLISLVGMLPTEMIAGGIALIVISLLYKILGRETQS